MVLPAPLLAAVLLVAPPQDCLWEERAPAPQPRVEAQSVVKDGKLYLFGGFYNPSLSATPRVDLYDPQSDAWTRLADMPVILTHHTAVLDGDTVWIVAGFLGDNGGPVMPSVLRYDLAGDTWSFGPQLPERRAGGALVLLERRLHYFGGFSSRIASAGEHFVLDLDDVDAGWDSTSFAPLPVARGHLSGAVLEGAIYAIGGQIGHDVSPQDLADVDRYDPQANAWIPVASLPFPRSHFEAATFVDDGRIVICGGRNNQPGGAANLAHVTAYDPVLDEWSELPPLPAAWLGTSVRPIGDRLFATTGGSSGNIPEAENFAREIDANLLPTTRINAGGGPLALSQAWCSDAFFEGGMSLSAGSPSIAGTTEDELYWTEHVGTLAVPKVFNYRLPVTPGDYRITLHFAETFWSNSGQRVFDVLLEGETLLDDYDIVAEVGPLTADVHVFDAKIVDGRMDLVFRSTVDRPKLSALEVERLPDGFLEVTCPGGPNSVGPGARLYFLGSTSIAEQNMTLIAKDLPPNRPAYLGVNGSQVSIPFGGGTLCLGAPVFLSPLLSTGPEGVIRAPVPLGPLTPVGPAWSFQVVYLDVAPFRLNFSSALLLHFTD